MLALSGCGSSPKTPAPPSYETLPSNLTASRLAPLPGNNPGRLSWGESVEWNAALINVIRLSNCDKALIRQIEQLRLSGQPGQKLPPPPECSLLNAEVKNAGN
ncbi:Rz1-like lysis system protein LysC [Enterobacter kobei]|uniref:Rz1-like lysis system protein LysC n=1 Tax=Enterobacter kobei TaxID=208224 RepID=UPI003CE8CEEC